MEKPIRVTLLGREYVLRVREQDEDLTRAMVAYVTAKIRAFKQTHPDQSDHTTAVITALALAEELFTLREAVRGQVEGLDATHEALEDTLVEALTQPVLETSDPAALGAPGSLAAQDKKITPVLD